MNSNGEFIVAIGQLPPPVTGLSYITARMIDAIKGSHDVRTANIAPDPGQTGLSKHIHRALRVLTAGTILLRHTFRTGRRCYLVCEGDWGLAYIIFLAALARICRYPTALHHHSFAYIDRPRLLLRLLLGAGGPTLTHVFLCPIMSTKFAMAYGIEPRACIVSNSAFVEPDWDFQTPTGPLTIGLLSNLTKEKGLHTFLKLVESAQAQGLLVRAILAGPAASETDRRLVESATHDLRDVLEYRGPLYGSSKDTFYRDIDIFVFPTQYSHEAEPTVIFEALSAGNLIIAFDRGCIASQVGSNGLIIPANSNFSQDAVDYLREAARHLTELRSKRHSRVDAYGAVHASSSGVAKQLFRNPTCN